VFGEHFWAVNHRFIARVHVECEATIPQVSLRSHVVASISVKVAGALRKPDRVLSSCYCGDVMVLRGSSPILRAWLFLAVAGGDFAGHVVPGDRVSWIGAGMPFDQTGVPAGQHNFG